MTPTPGDHHARAAPPPRPAAAGHVTVPAQRGTHSEDSTVLGMVLDGVREVKDTVQRMQSDINSRLDGFDAKYVPRAEIEARFNESLRDRGDIRQVVTEHKARHDTDVARLHAELETAKAKSEADIAQAERSLADAEKRRIAERRYAVGALISLAGLLITLLALVLTNHT